MTTAPSPHPPSEKPVELTYPSEHFPAPRSVTITLPDGWVPVAYPTVQIAAVHPAGPDGFNPSLTVESRSLPGAMSLDEAVDALIARDLEAQPSTLEARERLQVGGLDAIWLLKIFTSTERAPGVYFQAEVVVMAPRPGGGQDLVRAVGTCPGELADQYGPIFREAFATLVVD